MANQIEVLLKGIDKEEQIVIGARDLSIENVPLGSKFGRWFSNMWACWDTGYKITDSLSGFRLYPVSIVDLKIATQRFDWEMEVLVKHAWSSKEIKEQPVKCYYPNPSERVSHFHNFKDTMAIVLVHVIHLPQKFLNRLKQKLKLL